MLFYEDGKHSVIAEIGHRKVNVSHRVRILKTLKDLDEKPLDQLISNKTVSGPESFLGQAFYRLHVHTPDMQYRLPFTSHHGDYLILLLEPRHKTTFTITYDKALKRHKKIMSNQANYVYVKEIDLSDLSYG